MTLNGGTIAACGLVGTLTKICQLELPSVVDEQVLRFEVSVENFPAMAVSQATQDLKQEDLERER